MRRRRTNRPTVGYNQREEEPRAKSAERGWREKDRAREQEGNFSSGGKAAFVRSLNVRSLLWRWRAQQPPQHRRRPPTYVTFAFVRSFVRSFVLAPLGKLLLSFPLSAVQSPKLALSRRNTKNIPLLLNPRKYRSKRNNAIKRFPFYLLFNPDPLGFPDFPLTPFFSSPRHFDPFKIPL